MIITIRPATLVDVGLIFRFICDLAEYERLRDAVRTTADALAVQLFGPKPHAEVLIGEVDGTPQGFALFFHNFSTFEVIKLPFFLNRCCYGKYVARF